ncbi:MAG: acyl-CoA dehydrogenase family protein [Saprospiraceae bacterium]|nr:acyl-CoA dehydrogenase family protein [Saprospiraceae bacterium]
MNLYNEEHQLFRQSVKDFLKKEAMPYIDDWEKAGEIPRTIWKKFGDMGFLGVNIPEKYGGSGLDFGYQSILVEETSKCYSGGFSAAIIGHISLAMVYLERFGSEYIKERYLPKSCSGEWFGCLGVTEPFAGSDVAGIKTTAVADGDDYILNGSKTFITNGVLSDFLIIAAKTNPEMKSAGISLFVLDRSMPGISAHKLDKLGWHASDTAEISIQDVRVPAKNIIGEAGMGFYYIMQNFALERLILAIGAITACETAIAYTLKYMSERKAFGRPINKFQVLRHRMAQLASETTMLKSFNSTISVAFNQSKNVVKECAMAKLLCTELSDKVMTECLQCFGGYGYMEDYRMARMFRDSRLGTIGGGTSEIMRELISKMVIDDVSY